MCFLFYILRCYIATHIVELSRKTCLSVTVCPLGYFEKGQGRTEQVLFETD